MTVSRFSARHGEKIKTAKSVVQDIIPQIKHLLLKHTLSVPPTSKVREGKVEKVLKTI